MTITAEPTSTATTSPSRTVTAAYLRVSTGGQTTDQQHDALAAAGVVADTAGGRAGSDRPGWRDCLGWLRSGDTLLTGSAGASVRSHRR